MQIDSINFRKTSAFRPVNTFSHLRLSEVTSLTAVLACLDELRQREPALRFLCTLDDLNQCCYTHMHASQDDRLYLSSADVDFDDPLAVHAYEAQQLNHVQAQLDNPELRQSWDEVVGTLPTGEEDVDALISMNQTPDKLLAHDAVVYVQRVPVPRDDLAIAGLANGYFSCDWDVFQNHAVIRHLESVHGYRFFGIGASWLGFVRDQPPDAMQAQRLVNDLTALYAADDTAAVAQAWSALASVLTERHTLLLGYTENYAE